MNLKDTTARHWQFVAAFAFAAPTAALWAVKLLSPHAMPVAAHAKQSEEAFVQPGILNRTLSEAQIRLKAEQSRLQTVPFGPPPLRSTEARQIPVAPEETPVDPEKPDATKLFALSSIMRTPQGPLAVVNGKVRQQGAELSDGWSIENIDADSGEVHLRRSDGMPARLRLLRPDR